VYLYNFEAFTVPCELHLEAPTQSVADDAAQTVFTYSKQLEHRYGFFRETSEIYALNHRSSNSHRISDELFGLLQMAQFYTDMTHGAFDIALAGTLKAASKAPTLAEYQRLKEEFLPFASSAHFALECNRLVFTNEVTKIDLGGLVKEYAVDQAVLQLQGMGISSALINFGGDIATYGTCHDLHWRVGIQNPDFPDLNLAEIELENNSLCTSGHSKRFTTIEKAKITHIVGACASVQNYTQVSIVAPTTVDAGIWSTALLVNPELVLPSHIRLLHTI
jgi:FAD:protein FMN transferase